MIKTFIKRCASTGAAARAVRSTRTNLSSPNCAIGFPSRRTERYDDFKSFQSDDSSSSVIADTRLLVDAVPGLPGATFGVDGHGSIGIEVARRATGFGVEVAYTVV